MKRLWNFITGKSYKQYIANLNRDIAETNRQAARITAAYDLQKEVMFRYGVEFVPYLTDPESIITDNKAITMINYFNTDCIKFTNE